MEGSRIIPQDGLKVLVRARLTVYEARGDYQLVILSMEASGLGRFHLEFRRVKELLDSEGLLAPGRKKRIPSYPRKVALLTSRTGSVLWDFIRISGQRNPSVPIVIVPVRVQGAGVPEEMVSALLSAQAIPGVDVIVMARGGGSVEDLWPFNSERLARGILASSVPIVSAVGHETDMTISDLVSDLRVATPSEAAEKVIPDNRPALSKLNVLDQRSRREMSQIFRDIQIKNKLLEDQLMRFPESLSARFRSLDWISRKMGASMGDSLYIARKKLDRQSEVIRSHVSVQKNLLSEKLSKLSSRLRSPSEGAMLTQRFLSRLLSRLFQSLNETLGIQTGRLSLLEERLSRSITLTASRLRERLGHLDGSISHLGPMGVIQKGYALLFHLNTGQLVTKAFPPKTGESLSAMMDGYSLILKVESMAVAHRSSSTFPAIPLPKPHLGEEDSVG
jgi:exodeoxyribonuclease VII large subunit